VNFTTAKDTKLANIAPNATAYTDALARAAAVQNDLTPTTVKAIDLDLMQKNFAQHLATPILNEPTFTGLTDEIVVGTLKVDAGRTGIGRWGQLKYHVFRNDAQNTMVVKMYHNTTPSLIGASWIANYNIASQSTRQANFIRDAYIKSTGL